MLNEILGKVNDWMYTYLLLFLLVGTGIYFTIRTRCVQLRFLKESFRVLKEKGQEENGKKQVSSFQALMNCNGYCGRRCRSRFLDVAHGNYRRRFRIYRKYTCTGI